MHKPINPSKQKYIKWNKNIPFNYNFILIQNLKWPSLTIQWFPQIKYHSDKNITTQQLLYTTHTSKQDSEYLHIATISKSKDNTKSKQKNKIESTQQINVNNEINRARYNPFKNNLIATCNDNPGTILFDISKQNSINDKLEPEQILEGHEKGGYGIGWNNNKENEIATSDEDGLIFIYDIGKNHKSVHPKCIFTKHNGSVNDVAYCCVDKNMLVSVGDDKLIIIWDVRKGLGMKITDLHFSAINSVALSSISEYYMATGDSNGILNIWDIRNVKNVMNQLYGHKKSIIQIEWSPHFNNIICSASEDNTLCIWDINRVKIESRNANNSQELIFKHKGHQNIVNDFNWNPSNILEIASVAEDNSIHLWKPNENVLNDMQ